MEKHTKITLFIAGIVILFSVGLFTFSKNSVPSKQDSSGNSSAPSFNALSSSDWIKGNKEAKVTLVEYSDFQCPACGAYYFVLKQLEQKFGEDIVFVYRHFPLSQIHKNAELAARSAEAAGKQGKFWEMHDIFFENQKEWSNQINAKEIVIKYAQSLYLDIERFKNDLDSKEVKDKVNGDYQSGVQSKVNATPTFFLNGYKLDNPSSYEVFNKIIQEAVSKSKNI